MLVQTAERMFFCPSPNKLFSHVSDYYKAGPDSGTESTVYHQWSLTKTCPKKMVQEKKKDVQLQAMWFAAGTAAVMACLQRAILVSFMEQWRMLVFLALNLLLLAILFTSTHNPTTSISSNEGEQEISNGSSCTSSSVELEFDAKKSTGPSSMPSTDPKEHHEDGLIHRLKLHKCSSKTEHAAADVAENEEHVKNINEAPQELSKEELNRRAEAFIAMFRQHLLSDAMVGKSRTRHPYSHAKGGEIMSKRRAPISRRHQC